MIVVSNTSPIMNLAAIGKVNLLERLYGKVVIPKAVEQELSHSEDAAVILDDLITKAGFWVSRELYARVLEAAAE